ncbi:helix-turn-helix domain-containing protein [Trichococcus alkaliphilus]|uniref:helix-turn-helix domain-containing protein n=1 Tax=Trichococcus alkaliphilus TaxID=2052943 RepID=UPI000D0B9A83|nr:helix-turn-helix transcriptional regulator [Trichococcus alkaliphilus]
MDNHSAGFGKTLLRIRKNKRYSQQYMAENKIHQSTYSKMERDLIEPTLGNYRHLLSRLDMTDEEFHYIMHEYNYSEKEQLVAAFLNLSFNDVRLLKEIREKALNYLGVHTDYIIADIVHLTDALIILSETGDILSARKEAIPVWERLEKLDGWYLVELGMINAMLFLFPIDEAILISETASTQTKKYAGHPSATKIAISLRYNLCLLLLKNKRYEETIACIDELIPAAKQAGSYRHLSVCYLRKGFALAKSGKPAGKQMIDQAFRLIDAADDPAFKVALENEYNLLEVAASK